LRSAETPLRLTPPGPAERKRLLAGLARPPVEAARFLLGKILVRRAGPRPLAARIVETEAYLGVDDPAAHAFGGRRTRRTEPLWGPPGTIYVYFIYGMHHCLNVSVQREGVPGCVLIRAAEPLGRLESGSLRGPGRLCRALRLDTSDSGRYLFDPSARLTLREGPAPGEIGVSVRVGIRRAADRPLRFFDARSPDVS
jgi:DNA-3-methyladenine glycosylase